VQFFDETHSISLNKNYRKSRYYAGGSWKLNSPAAVMILAGFNTKARCGRYLQDDQFQGKVK